MSYIDEPDTPLVYRNEEMKAAFMWSGNYKENIWFVQLDNGQLVGDDLEGLTRFTFQVKPPEEPFYSFAEKQRWFEERCDRNFVLSHHPKREDSTGKVAAM